MKKKEEARAMKKNTYVDIDFTSDLQEAGATWTVKRDEGVIEGVVILTGEKVSRNKTFYTKKALQEAVSRYEGAKMYLDHPKTDDGGVRSVRDLGGHFQNVRIEEGKFLRGDLHLLSNSTVRDIVIPIAEQKIPGVGLSIRDRGRGRDENGVFLVEGFAPKGHFSIDLVTEASVNETLFESAKEEGDMKIEEIKLDDLQNGNPALVEQIRTETRDSVMKELEERLKKGEEAEKVIITLKKAKLLAEAKFPEAIEAKVKPLIEAETVSMEMAESILTVHKEILASAKTEKEPEVHGHGGGKEEEILEAAVPSDEKIISALTNA